ncbi:hypothetical protein KR222_007288 [Zaprionus bogoriensis]|nr:hypothetical protein KR222_007288 [Zaprionus bogoriensis]
MNQFHTPSFGDEVFEMNETPMEQPQHNNTASRRISRLGSLDHSTLEHVNDDQQLQQEQEQQQQQPPQQQPPQQQSPMDYEDKSSSNTQTHTYTGSNLLATSEPLQQPAKPLAPYALFFRDTMTAIKQQNPACTLEQITSIALNMWESIDEKQKSVYEQRHELEKREYVRQLRDYQRSQQLAETLPAATEQLEAVQPQQEQPQQQPQQQQLPSVTTAETEPSTLPASQPPEQIQLLTEAAAVQKCTRDQCNKPAIINPDWEDEYCSNECVVIHCRNVFSEWARSLQNSPT